MNSPSTSPHSHRDYDRVAAILDRVILHHARGEPDLLAQALSELFPGDENRIRVAVAARFKEGAIPRSDQTITDQRILDSSIVKKLKAEWFPNFLRTFEGFRPRR